MAKQNKNYLDLVPEHNKKYRFETNESGDVTIFVENRGIFNKAAQLLLKKPEISQIHLEGMGNFIWMQMDGIRTVYDIALLVKNRFGQQAEPLYDRLLQYLKTLEDYGFIIMKSG